MSLTGPFLVPQFIDNETKIIGSVTTRQFMIMMVAGMIDFLLYKLFVFSWFLIGGALITIILAIFAFARINGMPFHFFVLNMIQTVKKPGLRVWVKSEITSLPKAEKTEIKKEFISKPPIPASRLSSLSLVINTGGAYKEEE